MPNRWSYDYSPFTSQSGREIPAFAIFDDKGRTILMTNENHSRKCQENVACLAAKAPDLAATAERLILCWNNSRNEALKAEAHCWETGMAVAIRELSALLDNTGGGKSCAR